MPVIDGARCLDLFAGTGAIGMEALSRGAADAWFVERSPSAARALETVLEKLGCTTATVVSGNALAFLRGTPQPFDVVFLDPPFESLDLENLCTLLEAGWLNSGAHIYLELDKRSDLPAFPSGWEITREKTAGEVRFALAKRARKRG
jgi:16S rRNA (guanine966-N2)-methyltransferase